MPREKENYRDMLMFLTETKKLPLLVNRGQACEAMNISRDYLAILIAKGKIKLDGSKFPIMTKLFFLFSCSFLLCLDFFKDLFCQHIIHLLLVPLYHKRKYMSKHNGKC